MEKLAANLRSAVFDELPEYPPKELYLCSVDDLESVAGAIAPSSRHFGLFLALDALSIGAERIGPVAQELLKKGMVFLCAWGPDCERVHDTFDEVCIEMDPEGSQPVIMTTWHDDESIEEAVWFFVNSAFPDEAYAKTCRDWIFAPIGNRDWEAAIRASWSAKAT